MGKRETKKTAVIVLILIIVIILIYLGLTFFTNYKEVASNIPEQGLNALKGFSFNGLFREVQVLSFAPEEDKGVKDFYKNEKRIDATNYVEENKISDEGADYLFPVDEQNEEDKYLTPIETINNEIKFQNYLINNYGDSNGEIKEHIDVLKLQRIQEQFKLDWKNNDLEFEEASQNAINNINEILKDNTVSEKTKDIAREYIAGYYFDLALNKAKFKVFPEDEMTIKVKDVEVQNFDGDFVKFPCTPMKLKIEIKKEETEGKKVVGIKKIITKFKPVKKTGPSIDWMNICDYNKLFEDPSCKQVSCKEQYVNILSTICNRDGDFGSLELSFIRNQFDLIDNDNNIESSDIYISITNDFSSSIKELKKIKHYDNRINIKLGNYNFAFGNYKEALEYFNKAHQSFSLTESEMSEVLMKKALLTKYDENEMHPVEKTINLIDAAVKTDSFNQQAVDLKIQLQSEILKLIDLSIKERETEEETSFLLDTEDYLSRFARATTIGIKPEVLLKESILLGDESITQKKAILMLIMALRRGYFVEEFYGNNFLLSENPGKESEYENNRARDERKKTNIIYRILMENDLLSDDPKAQMNYYLLLINNLLEKNPDVALLAGGGTRNGAINVLKKLGKEKLKKYEGEVKVKYPWGNSQIAFKNIWENPDVTMVFKYIDIEEFIDQGNAGNVNQGDATFIFANPANTFYKYKGLLNTEKSLWSKNFWLKQINLVTVLDIIPYMIPFAMVPSKYAVMVSGVAAESRMITLTEWATIRFASFKNFAGSMAEVRMALLGPLENRIVGSALYRFSPRLARLTMAVPEIITVGAFFITVDYSLNVLGLPYAAYPINMFIMTSLAASTITRRVAYVGDLIEASAQLNKVVGQAAAKGLKIGKDIKILETNMIHPETAKSYFFMEVAPENIGTIKGLLSSNKRFNKMFSMNLPLKSGKYAAFEQYQINENNFLLLGTPSGPDLASQIAFARIGLPATVPTSFSNLPIQPSKIFGDAGKDFSPFEARERFILAVAASATKATIETRNSQRLLPAPDNGLKTVERRLVLLDPEEILGIDLTLLGADMTKKIKCCEPEIRVIEAERAIENGLLSLDALFSEEKLLSSERPLMIFIAVDKNGFVKFYSTQQALLNELESKKAADGLAEIGEFKDANGNLIEELKGKGEVKSITIPGEYSEVEKNLIKRIIDDALRKRGYAGRNILYGDKSKAVGYYADANRGDAIFIVDKNGKTEIEVATADGRLEFFNPERHNRVYFLGLRNPEAVETTGNARVIFTTDSGENIIVNGFQDIETGLTRFEHNGKTYVIEDYPSAKPHELDVNNPNHAAEYRDEVNGRVEFYREDSGRVKGKLFDNEINDVGVLDNPGKAVIYEADVNRDGVKEQFLRQNDIDFEMGKVPANDAERLQFQEEILEKPRIVYNSETGEGFVLNSVAGKYEFLDNFRPSHINPLGLKVIGDKAYVMHPWSKGEWQLYDPNIHGVIHNPVTGRANTIIEDKLVTGLLDSSNGLFVYKDDDKKDIILNPETGNAHEYKSSVNGGEDSISYRDEESGLGLVRKTTEQGESLDYCFPLDSYKRERVKFYKTPEKARNVGHVYKSSNLDSLLKMLKENGWEIEDTKKGAVYSRLEEDEFIEYIEIRNIIGAQNKVQYSIALPISSIKTVSSIEELREFLIRNSDKYELMNYRETSSPKIPTIGRYTYLKGVSVRKIGGDKYPERFIFIEGLKKYSLDTPILEEPAKPAPNNPNVADTFLPTLNLGESITIAQIDDATGELISFDVGGEELNLINPDLGTAGKLRILELNEKTGNMEQFLETNILTKADANGNLKVFDLYGRPIFIMPDEAGGKQAMHVLGVLEPKTPGYYETVKSTNNKQMYVPGDGKIEILDSNGNAITEWIPGKTLGKDSGIVDAKTLGKCDIGIQAKTSITGSAIEDPIKCDITITPEEVNSFELSMKEQGYKVDGVWRNPDGATAIISFVKTISTGGYLRRTVRVMSQTQEAVNFVADSIPEVWKIRPPIQAGERLVYADNDIAIVKRQDGKLTAVIPNIYGDKILGLFGEVIAYDPYKKQLLVMRDDIVPRENVLGIYNRVDKQEHGFNSRPSYKSFRKISPTVFWDILNDEVIIRNKETNNLIRIKPFFIADSKSTNGNPIVFFEYDNSKWLYEFGKREKISLSTLTSTGKAAGVGKYGRFFYSSKTDEIFLNVAPAGSFTDFRIIKPNFKSRFLGDLVMEFDYPIVQGNELSGKPCISIDGDVFLFYRTGQEASILRIIDLETKRILIRLLHEVRIIDFKFYMPGSNGKTENAVIYKDIFYKKERWVIHWPTREIGERATLPEGVIKNTQTYDPSKYGADFLDNEGKHWRYNKDKDDFDLIDEAQEIQEMKEELKNPPKLNKVYARSPQLGKKPVDNAFTTETAERNYLQVNPITAEKTALKDEQGNIKDTGDASFFKDKSGKRRVLKKLRMINLAKNELFARDFLNGLGKLTDFPVTSPAANGYASSDGNFYVVYEFVEGKILFSKKEGKDPVQQIYDAYPDKDKADKIRAAMALFKVLVGWIDSKPDAFIIPSNKDKITAIDFEDIDFEEFKELLENEKEFLIVLNNGAWPGISSLSQLNNQVWANNLMQIAEQISSIDDLQFYQMILKAQQKAGFKGNELGVNLDNLREIKKNSKLYAIKILKMLRKVGRLDPSVVIPEIPLTDPINLDSAGYLWRYNYEKQLFELVSTNTLSRGRLDNYRYLPIQGQEAMIKTRISELANANSLEDVLRQQAQRIKQKYGVEDSIANLGVLFSKGPSGGTDSYLSISKAESALQQTNIYSPEQKAKIIKIFEEIEDELGNMPEEILNDLTSNEISGTSLSIETLDYYKRTILDILNKNEMNPSDFVDAMTFVLSKNPDFLMELQKSSELIIGAKSDLDSFLGAEGANVYNQVFILGDGEIPAVLQMKESDLAKLVYVSRETMLTEREREVLLNAKNKGESNEKIRAILINGIVYRTLMGKVNGPAGIFKETRDFVVSMGYQGRIAQQEFQRILTDKIKAKMNQNSPEYDSEFAAQAIKIYGVIGRRINRGELGKNLVFIDSGTRGSIPSFLAVMHRIMNPNGKALVYSVGVEEDYSEVIPHSTDLTGSINIENMQRFSDLMNDEDDNAQIAYFTNARQEILAVSQYQDLIQRAMLP